MKNSEIRSKIHQANVTRQEEGFASLSKYDVLVLAIKLAGSRQLMMDDITQITDCAPSTVKLYLSAPQKRYAEMLGVKHDVKLCDVVDYLKSAGYTVTMPSGAKKVDKSIGALMDIV